MSYKFKYTANNYYEEGEMNVPEGEKNRISFTCKLKSQQCAGIKARRNSKEPKQRCRRNTVRALPYCWQHYQKVDKVIIKTSKALPDGNAGFGLFACDRDEPNNAVIFKKNDMICEYKGEVLTEKQLSERYGSGGQTATYTWQNKSNMRGNKDKDKYYDSACLRYIGAFANDARGYKANAKKENKKLNAVIQYKKPKIETRIRINANRFTNLPEHLACLVATKDIKNGDEIFVHYGEHWWKGIGDKYNVNSTTTVGRKPNDQTCTRRKSKRK
jgi:hypothetical protein